MERSRLYCDSTACLLCFVHSWAAEGPCTLVIDIRTASDLFFKRHCYVRHPVAGDTVALHEKSEARIVLRFTVIDRRERVHINVVGQKDAGFYCPTSHSYLSVISANPIRSATARLLDVGPRYFWVGTGPSNTSIFGKPCPKDLDQQVKAAYPAHIVGTCYRCEHRFARCHTGTGATPPAIVARPALMTCTGSWD